MQVDSVAAQEILFHRSVADRHWFYRPGKALLQYRHHRAISRRLGNTDEAADPLAAAGAIGEQAATKRLTVIFDIFKEQRAAGLAGYFARDRAKLFVPIDLSADALEILALVQIV